MGLLDALKHKVLVADGAMGTLLYSYGLENCHEEMNIEKPEIIKKFIRNTYKLAQMLFKRIHMALIESSSLVMVWSLK